MNISVEPLPIIEIDLITNIKTITTSDTVEKYLYNVLHCENGPAVVHADGTEEYWLYGKRHREDGPAVVSVDGKNVEYWVNGEPERLGLPAFVNEKYSKSFYKGKLKPDDFWQQLAEHFEVSENDLIDYLNNLPKTFVESILNEDSDDEE